MTSLPTILQHRVQLKNIAVLTDLSSDAERPLRLAASLAQWYGAKLTVAHAHASDSCSCNPSASQQTDQGTSFSRKQSEEMIRSLIGHFAHPQAMISSVVSASAVTELLEQLALTQPELLVLAPHRRSGIGRWLAGSVTAEVFRKAHWPVLVLPPGLSNAEGSGTQFQRVLYATDLSEVSARAFHYAAGMSEDHGAHMVALYVDSDGTAYSFERLIALQRLEDWLHRQSVVHGNTHSPECVVRFGKPAEEINQAASEYKAELIVLGARGLGAMSSIASHFAGGTAYEVACSSLCPVLIVPKAS